MEIKICLTAIITFFLTICYIRVDANYYPSNLKQQVLGALLFLSGFAAVFSGLLAIWR